MIDSILRGAFLHVDDLPHGVDLVSELRALNDPATPCLWVLSARSHDPHSPDRVRLKIGTHGDTGALMWIGNNQRLVPATGTNPDWATYYLAGMHDTHLPPHAEVPIETAYQALAEYLVTRERPTTIRWQPAQEE
ncbi:Imm1 family immunity protein [Actinokineospora cianjurensis]|uniref:Immunity protein Imm1 of predicted polymorphic toxin system n=1 Tax=Actinokineospora cianjurensis TaxID=585224 RepID=A0A421B5K9_9PSEU|nr:Imm1 family immunity protein [Actinokineospora cianjurensis]RLK59677.1 immunity protein Imm1 of predicted polymorphic toxin system [Actinokineospora cianjurensis]